MMYGNLTFDGKEIFSYNDFKVLADESRHSFKLQWKDCIVPDVGAESSAHLDCLARILELQLLVAGIKTNDIRKGLSRFRISNHCQERKPKNMEIKSS